MDKVIFFIGFTKQTIALIGLINYTNRYTEYTFRIFDPSHTCRLDNYCDFGIYNNVEILLYKPLYFNPHDIVIDFNKPSIFYMSTFFERLISNDPDINQFLIVISAEHREFSNIPSGTTIVNYPSVTWESGELIEENEIKLSLNYPDPNSEYIGVFLNAEDFEFIEDRDLNVTPLYKTSRNGLSHIGVYDHTRGFRGLSMSKPIEYLYAIAIMQWIEN